MAGDDAQVRLPPDLRSQCKARIEGTNFESVEEYVQFVMAALLEGDESGADSPGRPGDASARDGGVGTSRADDGDEVTDRLESLGYL